jgi:hypothetical protein
MPENGSINEGTTEHDPAPPEQQEPVPQPPYHKQLKTTVKKFLTPQVPPKIT